MPFVKTVTSAGPRGKSRTGVDLKVLAFGEGDPATVTGEVLRQAEQDPVQRPHLHVG